MKFLHAMGLLFFLSILTYIGVTHGTDVASIFNAAGPQAVSFTKALQGRG